MLFRSIGALDTVEVDFFREEVHPGDIVLLCSDGLTNMLEDTEIHRIVAGMASLSEKGRRLVGAANDNGGKDNIAVILINPFSEQEET